MLLANIKERRVNQRTRGEIFFSFLLLLTIAGVFIFSLEVISGSVKLLGSDLAKSIIAATSNPFVGLFIGLLSTAVLQSSSATTAIIVAVVSSGTISLESAIPMVMGANIGTTVTSTIVSLGHITRREEFRRAIAAATMHDFFNILVAFILFPVEYFTGFLSTTASAITNSLVSSDLDRSSSTGFHFLDYKQGPVSEFIVGMAQQFPLLMLFISIFTLIVSIKGFTSFVKHYFVEISLSRLHTWVFRNNKTSLAWGIGLTALLQSSSLTSSIIVPLVATKKVHLRKAFPFLLGANIGTTFTALLAAMTKSEAAISLAMTHLIFNVIGVLLMSLPFIKTLPIRCAVSLGHATNKHRMVGFLYLILLFFLIPFFLIYLTQ